jgi:hypothetical protein
MTDDDLTNEQMLDELVMRSERNKRTAEAKLAEFGVSPASAKEFIEMIFKTGHFLGMAEAVHEMTGSHRIGAVARLTARVQENINADA